MNRERRQGVVVQKKECATGINYVVAAVTISRYGAIHAGIQVLLRRTVSRKGAMLVINRRLQKKG